MPNANYVSATLTAADRDEVLKAIATIRAKLPFLIDLSTDERRRLPKMGTNRGPLWSVP